MGTPNSSGVVKISRFQPKGGKGVMFSDRSFYHKISWMAWAISMKLTGNIH